MDKLTMFALLCILVSVFWLGIKLSNMEKVIKGQQVVIDEYKHIMNQNSETSENSEIVGSI